MYSNIVKIAKKERNLYGTGIVLSENKVLTAAHVIDDEKNASIIWDEEFFGTVEYSDDIIAILTLEDSKFKEKYASMQSKLSFTTDELITDSSRWEIEGYITANLVRHRMEGVGICPSENPMAKFSVMDINAGETNNYQGLSGSPVIINGRVIGIVQIQSWDPKGGLGISFSSIEMFKDKLPRDVLAMPLYICELEQYCSGICSNVVNKNKEIAKYIPEIFIEESLYKENLRYFSLPILFINKIIEELKSVDFKSVNTILKKENKLEIKFTDYPDNVNPNDYERVVNSLKKELKRCICDLKQIDDRRDGSDSIEERYTQGFYLNNSLKWNIEDILNQLNFLEYRAVLLTRNAGQGKTNFVCDFTENFLIKRRILSMFFNASDFCETPSVVLKRILTLDGKYDEKYSIDILQNMWEKTRKPFIVVIDGLNENTSLPNFENHMVQSLKEWLKFPFLKIIMTTRCELLEERFGKLSQKNIGEDFFLMDMSGHREERFKNRIFEGYLRNFKVQIMRETLLDSTYELLTNDTLLLRFFCEVNRGKEQVYMYDVYKYTLFESYYDNKKKEIKNKKISGGETLFDQLISSICKYMIENKNFNNIPRTVFNINENQLLDILLEGDIIFKEDQIVKKGYAKGYMEVLSFTFDEFRDFCITQYLIHKSDAPQSFPVIWNTMCNEHWSILEGVEKYLFFLARTTVPDILPIIENNDNFESMYWENIWNLEDKDIKDQDIYAWKMQFKSKGPHRRRLIKYLLVRKNKDYFKNVTINLLFEIMDELADNPSDFDDFIKMFFPISRVDKYNQEIYQKNCVYNCNKMVNTLTKGMEDEKDNLDYYTYLKMSIYLYGMMPEAIKNMWIKALNRCSDVILRITNEFLAKEYIPVVIKLNLEEIYGMLITLTETECIKEVYSRCHSEDKYRCAHAILKTIWL